MTENEIGQILKVIHNSKLLMKQCENESTHLAHFSFDVLQEVRVATHKELMSKFHFVFVQPQTSSISRNNLVKAVCKKRAYEYKIRL